MKAATKLALRPVAPPDQASQPPSLWEQSAPLMTLDFRTVLEAARRVQQPPVVYSASGLGAVTTSTLTPTQIDDAKNTLAAAGVMLLLRGLAGWYVGSKLGRPTSGAVVGGLFGPVGLGVLSFWRK